MHKFGCALCRFAEIRHSCRHLTISTSSKHASGLNLHSIPVLKGTGSHSVKKSRMPSAQQANYPQNLFPIKNNPQVCTKGNPPYRHPKNRPLNTSDAADKIQA
ncbi:hypothetical protein COH79_12220, partial [Neisseria meningitidis]